MNTGVENQSICNNQQTNYFMIHWTAPGWRVVPIRMIAKIHISWLTVGWLFGVHFASLLYCVSYQDTMPPRKKAKLA